MTGMRRNEPITALVLASLLLRSAYDIEQRLFALSVPAAYDILAPTTISGLRAEFYAPSLSIVLHWNAHDPSEVDHYEVHRSTTPSFTPSAATLVGRPATTPSAIATSSRMSSITSRSARSIARATRAASPPKSAQQHQGLKQAYANLLLWFGIRGEERKIFIPR